MAGPPVACYPDDSLEDGLEMMQGCGVHQFFVIGASWEHVIEVLSFSEAARFQSGSCRACVAGRLLA